MIAMKDSGGWEEIQTDDLTVQGLSGVGTIE